MQRRNVWLATALLNGRVRNSAGEDLGKIEDIVIDAESGAIRYAQGMCRVLERSAATYT